MMELTNVDFPAPFGPDDGDHLTAADGHRYPPEGLGVAVEDVEVNHLQHRPAFPDTP